MTPSTRQHRVDPEHRRLTIRADLDRRRELGEAFVNQEVMAVTGYDRKTISGVTQRYVRELAAELMETVVENREAYERWERDYRTFRPFIRPNCLVSRRTHGSGPSRAGIRHGCPGRRRS